MASGSKYKVRMARLPPFLTGAGFREKRRGFGRDKRSFEDSKSTRAGMGTKFTLLGFKT